MNQNNGVIDQFSKRPLDGGNYQVELVARDGQKLEILAVSCF